MTKILAFQLPSDRAMAAVDANARRWIAAGERIGHTLTALREIALRLAQGVAEGRRAYARYRTLTGMSDAALAEIGLTRSEIPQAVARVFAVPQSEKLMAGPAGQFPAATAPELPRAA